MPLRSAVPLLLSLTLACTYDPAASGSGDPHADERGPLGKGDAAGTCEDRCGEKSDGNCYCDDLCVNFGDCCGDVADFCGIDAGGTPDAGMPDADEGDDPSLTSGDRAFFYGNAGTWGWLGLADDASLLTTPAQVAARFDELCTMARAIHPDGDALPCHADLIGVTPSVDIAKTEAVADAIINDQGGSVSIDLRTRGDLSFPLVEQKVRRIFEGKTKIVSEQFLRDHLVTLSLDLEPQVVDSGWRPSAKSVNKMCDAYRDTMISYGHSADELWCFLYEFGNPTMVIDGENLDPWIFPVLMTTADRPRVLTELNALGLAATDDNITSTALDLKEQWIDNVDSEYAQSSTMGCMVFVAPYLFPTQRDMFEFDDAVGALDDKCDIWSFQ